MQHARAMPLGYHIWCVSCSRPATAGAGLAHRHEPVLRASARQHENSI